MLPDEFLKKYHDYIAETEEEALKEIERMEPVAGSVVKAVDLSPVGWALMLESAADYVMEIFPELNKRTK